MRLENLIPVDKFDDSQIDELKTIDRHTVMPILDQLLVWLQDLNCPIAQKFFDVLPRFQAELTPCILEILCSDDDMWKNDVLRLIENFELETVRIVEPEIKRIANKPTVGELSEETPVYAKRIIDKFILGDFKD
ncbi:hypothetical protein IGI37_002592 [Enterococcus sp. AZ194]|uniref:DUF5071 domain-containing protein n=1 Tax=Enterococcus sp. AZ194 TaxID=2774629 RepID=UPI003F28616B